MKRRATFSAAFLAVVSALSLAADETDGPACIVYGSDWAFMVAPPKGWSGLCHAEQSHGVTVAIWPDKKEWPTASELMYVNVARKDGATIAEFIQEDLDDFFAKNPQAEVKDGGTIPSRGGGPLPIRFTSGLKEGRFEAIAYAEQPTVFLIFGLITHTAAERENSLPAFRALLVNYVQMKGVQIQNQEDMPPNNSLDGARGGS